MTSVKEVEQMFFWGVIEEIMDEEEFVLLYDAYRPSNLPKGRYKNTQS